MVNTLGVRAARASEMIDRIVRDAGQGPRGQVTGITLHLPSDAAATFSPFSSSRYGEADRDWAGFPAPGDGLAVQDDVVECGVKAHWAAAEPERLYRRLIPAALRALIDTTWAKDDQLGIVCLADLIVDWSVRITGKANITVGTG